MVLDLIWDLTVFAEVWITETDQIAYFGKKIVG
jgi:hypothetical protein